MTPVLKATGISVRFGGVRAVVDVDLEVGEGQLVGLIGPNGAGKTTFIDAISGFVRCDGRVELDGRGPRPRRRRTFGRGAGLARTWQSIELFDDLSVGENLLVASHRHIGLANDPRDGLGSRPALGRDHARPGAARRSRTRCERLPSELSQGQRKLVGIARALAPKPRIVCLDEPAAGLDTRESEELGARLRGLADDGQRCSSSTTTWVSCSGSATRWSCSSSAR